MLDWPAEGVELLVAHADSGAPAAEALVHYLSSEKGGLPSIGWSLLLSPGKLMPGQLADAHAYRTDEAGRVRVPEPSGEALVRVSVGELRGFEVLGGLFESDGRIELALPESLTIRVEDSLGSAVGGAEVACDGPWSRLVWGNLTANSGGEVQLNNANTLLAPSYGDDLPLLTLTGSTWDQQRITETVDLRAVPDDPVVLVLPAGGEVHVMFGDPLGNQLPSGGRHVALDVVQGSSARTLESWSFSRNIARFRGLPPGAQVTARLGDHSDGEQLAVGEGIVPLAGDEPLLLTVVVEQPLDRSVTGRLVDADGEPLADVRYSFKSELSMGNGSSSSSRGGRKTDEDGRFEEELDSNINSFGNRDGSLRLSFSVDRDEGPRWVSAPLEFGAELQLPMDVGDVSCTPPPLLVSGKLVDTSGDSIQGGRVSVSLLPQRLPSASSRPSASRAGRSLLS